MEYQPNKYRTYTPTDYVPVFEKYNISTVVRLNNATYDRKDFVKAGIEHKDMIFTDGTCPPQVLK